MPRAEIRVLRVRVRRVVVVMVVMVLCGKRRSGKHRQKQGSKENLFHGTNVARSSRNA
jgi:hypothetical protein